MTTQVAEIMSTDLVTARPTMSIVDVDALSRRHGVSSVPILEDGLLIGVVTKSDLLSTIDDIVSAVSSQEQGVGVAVPGLTHHSPGSRRLADRLGRVTARDVMTAEPVTIEADADVIAAARVMVTQHVHRLLVLDRGHLAGVLSAMDIVAAVAAEETLRAD